MVKQEFPLRAAEDIFAVCKLRESTRNGMQHKIFLISVAGNFFQNKKLVSETIFFWKISAPLLHCFGIEN